LSGSPFGGLYYLITMRDDRELLRSFAENGSQEAFRELVQRHIDLVYSAAVRRVGGDTHLAQDVTQEVFITLARHAGSLSRNSVLAGWLFTTSRFAASHVVRREQRRRERERKAELMDANEPSPSAEPEWHRLRPELDAVMDQLPARDRDALLLRFFERRSYAEVGGRLNLTEDAARRRVERALEKLRALLVKRGVVSPAAAVAAMLSNQAVSAAPSGLAAAVASAAFSSSGTTIASVLASLQLMSSTKLTLAAVAAAVAIAFAIRETTMRQRADAALVETGRQAAALTRTIEDLNTRAAAAGKDRAQLAQEIEAGRRQLAEVETRTNAPANPPARTDAVTAGREFVAQHPEARRLMAEDQKGNWAMKYAPLFKSLGLSAAQIDEVLELMVQGRPLSSRVTTADGGSMQLAADPQGGLSREETIARMRAVLGDDGFNRMRDYDRSAYAMEMVAKFNAWLFRYAPLQPAQIEQLARTLAQVNSAYQAGRSMEQGTFDWPALITQAQGFLSPPQVAALSDMQKLTDYRNAVMQLGRTTGNAPSRPEKQPSSPR
jgi:RNA polymerase sigma factor (sigma-70 family)